MTTDNQTTSAEAPIAHTGRKDYSERKTRRIDRLRERSASKSQEAASVEKRARSIAELIPLGQPILMGHHSAARHRRDLKRINDGFDRAASLANESSELARRASTAEKNRAISSDNPDAVAEIQRKIDYIERIAAHMKQANALIRKAKGDKAKAAEALKATMGIGEQDAAKLLTPDFAGRIGFAPYELTNRSAEVRRLKTRLASLTRSAKMQAEADAQGDVQIGDVTISCTDNRVQLHFPGKPAEAIRAKLKSHGFRWAPSEGAWQRHLSPDARYWAEYIAKASAEVQP